MKLKNLFLDARQLWRCALTVTCLVAALPAMSQLKQNTWTTNAHTYTIICNPTNLEANLNAAPVGATLVCDAGVYSISNLWRKSVNYHFQPGAIVDFNDTKTNASDRPYSIFDDRWSGAVTSTISGSLQIRHWVTNGVIDSDNCAFSGGHLGVTASVVVTNPASLVHVQIESIGLASTFYGLFGVSVQGCDSNSTIEVGSIYPLLDINGFDYDCPAFPGFPSHVGINVNGLDWGLGTVTIDVGSIAHMSTYSLNAYGTLTNDVADLHLSVHGVAESKFYMVGRSPDYKVWLHLDDNTTGSQNIECVGGGKYYIEAMKSLGQLLVRTNSIYPTETNVQVWLTAQKITDGWVDMECGEAHISAQHYEDTGSGNPLFLINGGELWVQGGEARKTTAGYGIVHHNGIAHFNDFDFRATNSATPAVFVSSSGLILKNCLLVTGNTNTIFATNAQTVATYSVWANKTNSAQITTTASGFTVNASAQ